MLAKQLEIIAEKLSSREARVLSLDEIADALGTLSVSAEEIDGLFTLLEKRGKVIGDPEHGSASSVLPEVLATARQLRSELGRAPSPAEIAARSQLSLESVHRALWFARIVQR